MKVSILILALFLMGQSAVFADSGDLAIGSRFLVQVNDHGNFVYRVVTVVGFAKDGDTFVSGMNGDPSAGLDRISSQEKRWPLPARDCEKEFCTNDQVIIGGLNGVSRANILYIDHDKKEAIVAVNNWANAIQKISLSDILSVPSYGPQGAIIEGSNFAKKDTLAGIAKVADAATPLALDQASAK